MFATLVFIFYVSLFLLFYVVKLVSWKLDCLYIMTPPCASDHEGRPSKYFDTIRYDTIRCVEWCVKLCSLTHSLLLDA